MTYTYRIYGSLVANALRDWRHVWERTHQNTLADPRFVQSAEHVLTPSARFWHVIFYDEKDVPVACATLSRFPVDLAIVAGKSTKQSIAWLRRLFPRLLHVNVLFCGLPVSVGHNSIVIAPDADAGQILDVLQHLVEVIARENGVHAIVWKEFGIADLADMDRLLGWGYMRAESPPMHHFRPEFADFADYASNLKSHYRNDINRSKRKARHAELVHARARDTDTILRTYTEEVHQLYRNVVARSDNQLESLPRSFFLELAARFSGEISLSTLSNGGAIVAFNWGLRTSSVYHFLFCGIDYDRNTEADLYFNIMYEELDNALREGVEDVEVGQTADTFKARLGCYSQPLHFYVKMLTPILNGLLEIAFPVLFPARPAVPTYSVHKTRASLKTATA